MKISPNFKQNEGTSAAIEDDVYYPLVRSPFGNIPLVGATMTDEKERELAKRYPVREFSA